MLTQRKINKVYRIVKRLNDREFNVLFTIVRAKCNLISPDETIAELQKTIHDTLDALRNKGRIK
jgi:hypothetical protein